jgi:hypothetical protein
MAARKGIQILFNLLFKDAIKKSGQASGIMSIGDNVRKLAEKRLQSYLLSAQKQGIDIDAMNEDQIKYMLEMNKPKAPRVISQGDPEFKGITEALLGKQGKVIEGKFGKPFKEEIGSVDNVINNITRMEPVAAMKEVNKVLRREGKYKNLSKQDSEKVFNDTDDWINQRDPADLYDYKNKRPFREDPNFDPDDPDFDPENMADGGRIGLKDGMNRRTFLKIFGGLVSLPIIGKVLKPLKTVKGVKNVPIIKTDDVAGKPEWFDALVNKVIREGDDVTRNFQTKERQIVHAAKIDEDNYVRVTQDLDEGTVRVEYESEANVYGDPVQMQYKKPLPDEGDPRPTAEFTTAESGPVGRADGPDDYSIEIDEIGGTSIRDLDSDVSKLKEFATGKKPTMKELLQNIERRKKAQKISEGGESEMDAVIRRQGEYIENDLVDLDPPDYASGGIAGMLGE